MGMIMNTPDGSDVHAEARRESFTLYTDFGHERIELLWKDLPHLKTLLADLERHAPPQTVIDR